MMVLHDPKDGDYASRDPIGAGDFITAPEISQMFGELCGLWTVQDWRDQGRSDRPRLVEFGPGRGTLMADALRAIAAGAGISGRGGSRDGGSSPVLHELQRSASLRR